ncbi:energy transducer TonB [Lysobacter alkalisoli]|uniref:Protein TonB n=2 Tax=Marilutibacter alkalisoli TaxID=2591633 RepID=A0A514BW69_9GAMM|nr:energy transducer TonB [Lysobacter alkalisoli]
MHDRVTAGCAAAGRVVLLVALGLALVACGQDAPAPATPAQAPEPEVAETPAETAETDEGETPDRLSTLDAGELREAARQAYAENRLYAPTGNNAVEYYLALREKAPADAAVSSALTDLLPMTVIAIEQSVQREDFDEALRLTRLLARADPQHPALARLNDSIEAQQTASARRVEQERIGAEERARRQEELERQRLTEQQAQQQQAARELAAQQEAARQQAEQEEAERIAAERRAAEQRAADQRAAQQRAAEPVRATAADLRPLSTPAPRYPPEALRAGTSGEVQIEFTVGTDGSVTSARVVRSSPPRVFDREAVAAVRNWRFQPLANPVTTRRTIGFSPGGEASFIGACANEAPKVRTANFGPQAMLPILRPRLGREPPPLPRGPEHLVCWMIEAPGAKALGCECPPAPARGHSPSRLAGRVGTARQRREPVSNASQRHAFAEEEFPLRWKKNK